MIAFGKEIVVLGALKNQKEPPTGGIGGRELNNYEMGKGAVVGMEREVHCPYLPQRFISTFHWFYYTRFLPLKHSLCKQ